MVNYGMPEIETIKSATIDTAKLLDIENELGSIDVGKIADIIAVKGDPITDISIMKNISFVMKEGQVVNID